jgi:inner membrane protein
MRFWLILKLIAIGGLSLVILIALFLVDGLITDRENYRKEATVAIASGYASEQRVLGPVLVQPYRQLISEERVENGKKQVSQRTVESTYTVFPTELNVKGEMKPSVRRHGLYRVPVYEFDGAMSGHVDAPAPKLDGKVEFGVPYLAFRVKDARGIIGRPAVKVNGAVLPVEGVGLTKVEQDSPVHPDVLAGTNLRIVVPGAQVAQNGFDFSVDLSLAGTQTLEIVPVADSNRFDIASSWAEPLFAGQFLPRDRQITESGFHATWDISSLATAAQQQTTKANGQIDAVNVSLTQGVDASTLSDRAVKYGILFVFVTFGGFFLFELAKKMLIHPVQYLLVGACLTMFFLLLVSFSEHISFGYAYLIASAACIGVLTYYLVAVLKSRAYGFSFGAILTTMYAAIYGLLVSEDNALLLGSVMLFGLIAIAMIGTRHVDWYQKTADLGSANRNPPPPPSPFTSAAGMGGAL